MKNQNILTLDLATKTGWAIRMRDGTVSHGVIVTRKPSQLKDGQRWVKFRAEFMDLLRNHSIHEVGFEQIDHFAPMRGNGKGPGVIPTDALLNYGGLRAILEMICTTNNIPLHGFHIGKIKKQWTGNGQAKKDMMIAQAFQRGYKPMDDNAADALAILDLMLAEYGGLENGSEI